MPQAQALGSGVSRQEAIPARWAYSRYQRGLPSKWGHRVASDAEIGPKLQQAAQSSPVRMMCKGSRLLYVPGVMDVPPPTQPLILLELAPPHSINYILLLPGTS